MSQTFDIKRFGKVMAYDIQRLSPRNFRSSERTGNMGINIISFAFMPVVISLVTILMGEQAAGVPVWVRWFMLLFTAVIMACLVPEVHYNAVNQKKGGSYYAMLPASKLEKYLSMLLYTFIVCPLLVYIGSLLLDVVLTILPIGPYKNWIWEGRMGFPLPLSFGDLPRMEFPGAENFPAGWFVVSSLTSYIASTAIFVFTATVFKKHKVLFTLLWLYLIQFVLSIAAIPVGISMSMSPDMMEWLYDSFHDWSSQQAVNLLFGSLVAFNLLLGGVLLWLTRRRLNRMPY